MSTQSIAAPFPIFTDLDGQPLEAGYIWIGVENMAPQTNPVVVYWDSALTQPAAQPIRTSNGLPLNNGSPSRLYTASGYSILVQDKRGMLVYSAPSAADLISSDLVTFVSSGAGAVARTVESKLREWISVKDFGAVGDGVTDDWQAIENAILAVSSSGGGTVFFPKGTYIVGYALSLKSNVRYLGEERDAAVLKASNSSQDNILGWGYPLINAFPLARAVGGTITRLRKPDFLTDYTEQEALITGGMAGYAVTNATIENITFDGNKAGRAEGSMNLQGTPSGTFLIGETVTASGGRSAVVSGVFGGAGGISVEPRTIVGTFSVGNVITGVSSGATMTITAKAADDAYQNNVRFDAVSHSVVRNCVFKNSVFTALSIYNYANHNIIEGNLFYDNNKSGTTYIFGWINIYVEFDANHNIIRDNLIIGGLGYSVLVSCPGGTNRDTWLVNNTIYNPASDGIRISIDSATDSIIAPRVLGNTVVGASAVGAVGIRLNHGGASGSILDAVVANNTVRDSTNGILLQGRVQYAVVSNNTARNNAGTDIASSATLGGNVVLGNAADSTLSELMSQPVVVSAGAIPVRYYAGSGDVGVQYEVAGVGIWHPKHNGTSGNFDFESDGSRKASVTPGGDIEGVTSAKGGLARLTGRPVVSVSTSATTIASLFSTVSTNLFQVSGDNGSVGFNDLVMIAFGFINVISSNTSYGAPPTRTYTRSGTNLQLALSSGTLNIRVTQIGNEF